MLSEGFQASSHRVSSHPAAQLESPNPYIMVKNASELIPYDGVVGGPVRTSRKKSGIVVVQVNESEMLVSDVTG
jgi:hypothetical protein